MRFRGSWEDRALDRAFGEDDAEYRGGRYRRSSGSRSTSLEDARRAWEPVVCAACGARHPDTRTVRLRRTGRTVEARCSACGAVAAVYAQGVWSS